MPLVSIMYEDAPKYKLVNLRISQSSERYLATHPVGSRRIS
ncbi:hypothetical protein [Nostoc sp.]